MTTSKNEMQAAYRAYDDAYDSAYEYRELPHSWEEPLSKVRGWEGARIDHSASKYGFTCNITCSMCDLMCKMRVRIWKCGEIK